MRARWRLFILILILTACDQVSGIISTTAPQLENLTPTSFVFNLGVNQTVTQSFSFDNTGNAELNFSISESAAELELIGSRSGTLAPNSRFSGNLQATCLAEGVFDLSILLETNDRNLTIEVSLVCTASAPHITSISPNPLQLQAEVNSSSTGQVSFENRGQSVLDFSIANASDFLDLSPLAGSVYSGERQELDITASCSEQPGPLEGSFQIISNDPEAPVSLVIVDLDCQPRRFRLSVEKAGAGSGRVSSTPAGIDCGESCSLELDEGSDVSLDAVADEGSIFVGFSSACQGLDCHLSMDADKTVIATFATTAPDISEPEPNPLMLTATTYDTASGIISFENSGDATLEFSVDIDPADAFLSMTPRAASVAAGGRQDLAVNADCPGTAGALQAEVYLNSNDPDEPLKALTVVLHCVTREFTLTVNKTGTGTGSVVSDLAGIDCGEHCDARFADGTGLNLLADASADSVFTGFSGACQGSTCALTMTADATVNANFDELPPEPDMADPFPNPLVLSTVLGNTVGTTINLQNLGEADLNVSVASLPAFLTIAPTNITLAPGSIQQLSVSATCPSSPGILSETVHLNSNDPDEPVTPIFVQLDCIARDFTLTLIMEGLGQGSVLSTPAGINCRNSCTASFSEGTSLNLQASPDEDALFDGFTGACQGKYCALTMTADLTVRAHFNRAAGEPDIVSPSPNPLRLSTYTNGTISGSTSIQNIGDAPLTIAIDDLPDFITITPTTATLAPGSILQLNVRASCPDSAGLLSETISINSNDPDEPVSPFEVQLTCSSRTFTLLVNQSGSGSGTVVSSPGAINCGTTCVATFAEGEVVTLNASADAGSVFNGFSGSCQGTSCTLTMNSNLTVNADFSTLSGGNFNIDLRFIDNNMSASQQAIFEQAASRWEAIITNDLFDVTISLSAADCSGQAFSGTVDDIVIDAIASSFDGVGGLLGRAGPCALRGNLLPFFGVMEFDQADLDALEATGQLEEVILHEMAHVLGIGTLWGPGLFNLLSFEGADCLSSSTIGFTGLNSAQEFVILGGGGTVPVENDGGPGTKCGHWDEEAFGNELMTGFLNGGTANPLSRLTIASLKDISYSVNFDTADPYTLSSISPSVLEQELAYREILVYPTIILPADTE